MAENDVSQSTRAKLDDKQVKFIIKSLNIHGSFFHKKCMEVISQSDAWIVKEKEVPVVLANQTTRLDIVAEFSASVRLNLAIECKKVDPTFKSWLFFVERQHGTGDHSYIERYQRVPLVIDSLQKIENTSTRQHLKWFFTPKDNRSQVIPHPVCYDGYEIKFDRGKRGKLNFKQIHKSARKVKIEDACNQVLLGSRGFVLEVERRLVGNPNQPFLDLFLPLIITTADLYTCDVDSQNINLQTGEVTDNTEVKLESQKWLVYNYKPAFLVEQPGPITFANNPSKGIPGLDYMMSVFIVNAEYLSEFLDKIRWSIL